MQQLLSIFIRIRRSEHGTAAIEFAIALPLLLIMIFGIIEVTRYIQFHEKVESAAVQMIDIINQEVNVSNRTLTRVFNTSRFLLRPFDRENAEPKVTVTMVENPGTPNRSCVGWRYGSARSKTGAPQGTANLGGLVLEPNNQVMVIEMVATYTPLIDNAYTREWINGDAGGIYVRKFAHTRLTAFRFNPSTGLFIANACCYPAATCS